VSQKELSKKSVPTQLNFLPVYRKSRRKYKEFLLKKKLDIVREDYLFQNIINFSVYLLKNHERSEGRNIILFNKNRGKRSKDV
jgi:hypothetical protein